MSRRIRKWPSELTMRFMEEYGERKCLWDQNSPHYKNKDARELALKEIIDTMGLEDLDINGVKSKIRILRNTYINELKKISASNNTYKTNLPWFPIADDFLRGAVIQNRKTEVNMLPDEIFVIDEDPLVEEDLTGSDTDNDHTELQHETASTFVHAEETISRPQQQPLTYKLSNEYKEINIIPPLKRKRPLASRSNVATARSVRVTSGSSREDDEFDLFGKSIASQLKKLPLQYALELQGEIQNAIVQTRLKLILGDSDADTEQKIYMW